MTRKLRNELRELRNLKAQVVAGAVDESRSPIPRRQPSDWICGQCQYYCYFDKSRCPKCSASKALGQFRLGYRRRLLVENGSAGTSIPVARPTGLLVPPTRRVQRIVQQVAPVSQTQQAQKSYAEAVKTQRLARSQAQTSQAQAQQQNDASHATSQVHPAQQQHQPSQVQPTVQYAPTLLVGPRVPVAAGIQAPAVSQSGAEVHPPLIANIFSADEEAGLEQDDAWADETIQELDTEEKDPHKVWSRIGKISKAVEKRKRRLEKARVGIELQKAAVEEANTELAARTQAAEDIAADIRRLNEVQQDLAAKHQQLLAEVGRQQQGPAPSLEGEAEKAQRLLWDVAANLRTLGDNPRLSQAIALLGDLYLQASQVAAGGQGAQPAPAPVLCPAGMQSPVPVVEAPPILTTPSTTIAPQQAPLCHRCWSFACNCAVVHSLPGPSTPPCTAIEVDLERGQKRSCRDASLPDRPVVGPQRPEAILVDSEGNAATAPSSDESSDEKIGQCEEGGVIQPLGHDLPKQEPSVSLVAETVEVATESTVLNSSGIQPGTSQGESEDDKAESRKAFAALVREACSSRSYPY